MHASKFGGLALKNSWGAPQDLNTHVCVTHRLRPGWRECCNHLSSEAQHPAGSRGGGDVPRASEEYPILHDK